MGVGGRRENTDTKSLLPKFHDQSSIGKAANCTRPSPNTYTRTKASIEIVVLLYFHYVSPWAGAALTLGMAKTLCHID